MNNILLLIKTTLKSTISMDVKVRKKALWKRSARRDDVNTRLGSG